MGMIRAMRTVDLDIKGMTCASCAAHIQKRLRDLDGVEADVNYATERATVTVNGATTTDDLIAEVEAIGYSATLPAPDGRLEAEEDDEEVRSLRRRLVVSAALGVPVLVLSMITVLQFTYWQWV